MNRSLGTGLGQYSEMVFEEKREKERAEEKTKKDRDEKTAKDEITEADIKVERKDGRRTPLHARDMEAVRILVIDLTLIFNWTPSSEYEYILKTALFFRMNHTCI